MKVEQARAVPTIHVVPESSLAVLTEFGDLCLKYKYEWDEKEENVFYYLVSSQVLRMLSSVFRERIDNAFANPTAPMARRVDDERVYVILEIVDKVEGIVFESVLNFTHHKYKLSSGFGRKFTLLDLDMSYLMKFVTLTEKYDLHEPLSFVLQECIESHAGFLSDEKESTIFQDVAMLYICWNLRNEVGLKLFSARLIPRAAVNAEGKIYFKDTRGRPGAQTEVYRELPQELMNRIRVARGGHVAKIKTAYNETFKQILETYEDDPGSICEAPRPSQSAKYARSCHLEQIGSLTIFNRKIERNPALWNDSLFGLDDIAMKTYQAAKSTTRKHHEDCRWELLIVGRINTELEEVTPFGYSEEGQMTRTRVRTQNLLMGTRSRNVNISIDSMNYGGA